MDIKTKITIEEFDELTGEVHALKALVINLRDLLEGGLATNNLHSNAIQTNNIKNDAITSNKIIADSITAEHIQALAIDASKIAVGTITADQIEDGTISADKILTGTLTALQISSGTITAGLLKTGGQAFSHNITFSSTDADTVSWTSGTLKTADGTSYSIDAGNTGNMAARTYIYLDKGVSETVLQISTSYDAPLGDEKIPIATAENSTNNAVFQVFAGGGGVFISGNMIAAHTIAATQIVAGTITATEITVSSLSSLNANIGTVTAGTINGVQFRCGGGTDNDFLFEDSSIYMYDIGNYKIGFKKTGYQTLFLGLATDGVNVGRINGSYIGFLTSHAVVIDTPTKDFYFYTTGTFRLPALTSAPTAHQGDLSCNATSDWFSGYISDWEHFQTSEGW